MDERAMAAAARAESLRQHRDALVELLALQIPIAIGAAHELEQLPLPPLPRGDLGGDLLSEHVERILRHDQPVQFAAPHRIEQRGALHELVARQGKQPALGDPADRVSCASHALQEGAYRAGGADLADQIDVADVDAELEGGGRHQRLQLPALQALLGLEPPVSGETAVMRGDIDLTDALRDVPRQRVRPAGGC